jgi:zinc protease
VTVRATYVHRPIEQYRVTISFGSDPERADELIRTVFAEIDRLKMDGPTEDQVADVQAGMGRALETNLERNIYWLSQLAFAYQLGVDPGSTLMSARASIEALTVSTLRDVATRYLDTDHFVRVTLLPER